MITATWRPPSRTATWHDEELAMTETTPEQPQDPQPVQPEQPQPNVQPEPDESDNT